MNEDKAVAFNEDNGLEAVAFRETEIIGDFQMLAYSTPLMRYTGASCSCGWQYVGDNVFAVCVAHNEKHRPMLCVRDAFKRHEINYRFAVEALAQCGMTEERAEEWLSP